MAERGKARAGTRRPRGKHPAIWRPSALQRQYRAVLDSAKSEPQTIIDSDDSMLVLQLKDESDFNREVAARVAELARFHATYLANRDKPIADWAAQTAYPWLVTLPQEEVKQFAGDLLGYTLGTVRRGSVEELDGIIASWKSTAEVHRDPELLAKLSAPIDYDQLEEVFPPAEAETKTDEA